MNIGILTFHCSYNFGAVLQCYVLQDFLSSLGHNVIIINYRPKYLLTKRPSLSIKQIIKHPLQVSDYLFRQFPLRLKRFQKFERFEEKYYILSKICYTSQDVETTISDMDWVVFGSDQIWCEKFNGADTIWYGNLKHNNKTKFITYAASAGDVVFSEEGEIWMHSLNKNFSAISVRERKLYHYLDSKVQLVLDPTLMISDIFYGKWYNPVTNDRYVLVRQARPDSNIYRIARIIAKQLGAKIITADMHQSSFQYSDKVLACSPPEFVSLVKNSLCVISNSFHGIALALACKVPFYAIRLNDGGDERVCDLLDLLGLKNRILDKDSVPNFSFIDFSAVNDKIEKLRFLSQNFLIQHII